MITESENHKSPELVGTYQDHQVWHLALHNTVPKSPTTWLRILSKCTLNFVRLVTIPLGSLLQCPPTLWVKNLFLTSDLNLSWHFFRPFSQVLSVVRREERFVSAPLLLLPWKLQTVMRSLCRAFLNLRVLTVPPSFVSSLILLSIHSSGAPKPFMKMVKRVGLRMEPCVTQQVTCRQSDSLRLCAQPMSSLSCSPIALYVYPSVGWAFFPGGYWERQCQKLCWSPKIIN